MGFGGSGGAGRGAEGRVEARISGTLRYVLTSAEADGWPPLPQLEGKLRRLASQLFVDLDNGLNKEAELVALKV